MCFAPQRRALFRHLNFQKWSEHGVFCTFWLRNVLRATTACNFSSLIWPAGSAPAALASLLFDPPEPQIIGKTQCVTTFLPFRASASSFFWLFLFSDLLSSNLSLLSASPLLCFSSVHIVGSLTSKLPSMITIILLVCLQIGDTPRKMMMTMGCMMLSFDAWCHIQPSPHIMSTWLCVSHGILFYTSEDPLWLILPLDKLRILTMVGKMGQLTFRVGYSWNFLMVIIQIIQWNCG